MKSIVITGASSGIGKELAMVYAKRKGVKLILIARNIDRLENVAEKCRELGADVQIYQVDVNDSAQMAKIMEESDAHTVYANAGISGGPGGGKVETMQQTHSIINTNLFGVINTVMPVLGKAKRIAIISSMAGFRGLPTAPAYSTSKCAVRAWGEALHGLGFPITIVCPGFIKTGMTFDNRFPMPFIMAADKAAKIIIKGVEKEKRQIIFPFGMRLVAFIMKYMPDFVLANAFAKLPAKQVLKSVIVAVSVLLPFTAAAQCPEGDKNVRALMYHDAYKEYAFCAEENGDILSFYNAGVMAARTGNNQDAAVYFKQASESGIAQAQVQFGMMLVNGHEFADKDPANALKWFMIAAEPAQSKWFLPYRNPNNQSDKGRDGMNRMRAAYGQKFDEVEKQARRLALDWKKEKVKEYAKIKLSQSDYQKFVQDLESARAQAAINGLKNMQ